MMINRALGRLLKQGACSIGAPIYPGLSCRQFSKASNAEAKLSKVKLAAFGGGQPENSVGELLKKALSRPHQDSSSDTKSTKQEFDYFVVVDFEATCDKSLFFPQEIIEFPSVLVAVDSLSVEASFQTYVKPVFNPQLTEFCKELTGITQDQVDEGVALGDALVKHDKWLEERGVKNKTFGVITWTDWDCKVMLEFECRMKNLTKPPYFNRWINLKSLFQSRYGDKFNLKKAVLHAGLEWQGREHCGLDDAMNTASLAVEMIRRGISLSYTDPGKSSSTAKKPGSGSGPNSSSTPTPDQADFIPKLKRILESIPRSEETSVVHGESSDTVCYCGVRCKTRLVKRGGPNKGKVFLSCGNWTLTEGGKCTFFEWKSSDPSSSTESSTSDTPSASSS